RLLQRCSGGRGQAGPQQERGVIRIMSDSSAPDIAHPSHNPFDLPRPRQNNGLVVAIIFSLAFHLVAGYYLWKSRFKTEFQNYADEKVQAELIKPPAPPP